MADVEASIAKAKSEVAQGDDRFNGTFIERMLKDKTRFGDAADHYNKAANFFKLAKALDQAGQYYKKAGECFYMVESKHDAASAYSNAAKCLQKIDLEDSLKCYGHSIKIMLDEGRLAMAAKSEKEIAEMCEQERDYARAIEHYSKAAEYYETESNHGSNSDACWLKAAHLYAHVDPPQFDKAAEIFEKCGKEAATASGTARTFSAKEYLFKAALCRLALGDIVGTKRAIEEYPSYLFQWPTSQESRFLTELIQAMDDYDADAFTAAVQDWNSTNTLDQWRTNVLLKIKNGISDPDENPLL